MSFVFPPAAILTMVALGAAFTARPVSAQVGTDSATNVIVRTRPDTLTLSIADVQRLAVRQNPAFLATAQESAIARGERRQAGMLRFNPDLALQSSGAAGGTSRGPLELVLTQEIEWAGQRGLRIDAADARVLGASGIVRNAGRLTIAEGSASYFRAVAAQRRLAVTRDALSLTERLFAAVRIQLREGEISTLEANLAEIEFGRARGRVLAAERSATSASLALKRLLGLTPDTPIKLADDGDDALGPVAGSGQLDEDSLIAVALKQRPDIAASAAFVREAERLTALARREALPNLRLGAAAERAPGSGTIRVGPAIGLSLPLFNRNQGVVAQRRARAEQARLDRQATELRVRTEVVDALRAYQTATEETAVYASSVLRRARDNTELLETAFRAGKIALPTLLLLRNQLLDAELGYWDAWLARREALVQLDAATGALALPAADPSARTTP